jgi:hypothetical protein
MYKEALQARDSNRGVTRSICDHTAVISTGTRRERASAHTHSQRDSVRIGLVGAS